MNTKSPTRRLNALGLAIGLLLAGFAPTDEARAGTEDQWPQDVAVIDVATPREGNLLQLRGIVGRGTALFRVNGVCHAMPVRLVAGDFSGRKIGAPPVGPIRIVITGQDEIRSLLAGRDIVSDTVRVASGPGGGAADLYLVRGLSPDTGFIINAGRNLFADILGAAPSPTACDRLAAALPAQ